MSFARFSSSDVYVFEHVGGFIECCGCWLVDWEELGSPRFKTPREALAHLDEHVAAGYDIGGAYDRIEKEYVDLDAPIDPYIESPEVTAVVERMIDKMFKDTGSLPERFRDVSNGE